MTKSKAKEVSIREFGRQIGVSEAAIRKAIKEGTMTKGYNATTKTITPSVAKEDVWVSQQAVIKPKAGVSRERVIEKLKSQKEEFVKEINAGTPAGAGTDTDVSFSELMDSIHVTASMSYRSALEKREIVALALDKLRLKREEGILVDKAAVNSALFKLGNEMKRELLNIPKRIARDMMAAPNEVEAINIMNDEINRMLSSFAALKINKV